MNRRLSICVGSLGLLAASTAGADDSAIPVPAWTPPSMHVWAQAELLPLGSHDAKAGGASVTSDAELAYGMAVGVEYAVHPLISIGVTPRLLLHVQPKSRADVDERREIDLRGLVRVHYPLSLALEAFAAVTPGYAVVLSNGDGVNTGGGFAIGGAAGVRLAVSPSMFVSGEVGYQRAFTSATQTTGSAKTDIELDLSYPHVALGAGARF